MNSTETQNKNDLSIIDHGRLGVRVLSRIFQWFVAWPAALVATYVLAMGVAGESPPRLLTDSSFVFTCAVGLLYVCAVAELLAQTA